MKVPTRLRLSQLGNRAQPLTIADLMQRALEIPGLLSLAAGFTDTASLPLAEVAESVRRLEADGRREPLQYGSNIGRLGLREWVARRLMELDGADAPQPLERVFITNGSQQALILGLETICEPGDILLVESPTYFVLLEAAATLGLDCRAMPCLPDGSLDLEALPKFLAALPGERVRALYLQSYFANPTSRSRSAEEKAILARALADAGLVNPVIEDAAYRELYFDGPAEAVSVFEAPQWEAFPKLYLGTFTKPFASGLKVGFGVCSDERWQRAILALKGGRDFGTAHFCQALVEDAVLSGAYDRHLSSLRMTYSAKARVLGDALAQSPLQQYGWAWERPSGGLYYWLRGPGGFRSGLGSALEAAALHERVLYVPGALCQAGGEPDHEVRLSFGVLSLEELPTALDRFVTAVQKVA
ncbi:MAG: PLP-dependent aminotransferase family protein [Opitutales bacterium]